MSQRRPAQERAIRTREAILAAAGEEFARRGCDGARIDAIARRSRANKQRIYAYFGSKDGLFRAVQADAIAGLCACEEAILARAEPDPARLTALVRDGYVAFHRDHPDFWRILAWANLAGVVPHAAAAAPRAAVLGRMEAMFRRAQACGGAPAGAAFAPWLIAITAIVHFAFANRRTASVNLGLSLPDAVACEGVVRDAIALLGPAGPAPGG